MSLFIENITEQTKKNKWYLMLCHLHHPELHGKTQDSDQHIESHYLVYDRFEPTNGISYMFLDEYEEIDTDDEYESNDDESNDDESNENGILYINDIQSLLLRQYVNLNELNNLTRHPTIRNYHNIIKKSNYIKPEIGEYIILPTQEAIAILKTIWLRIIQRKWKKIFEERKLIIKKRSYPDSLYIRSVTGKWPDKCNHLPGLKGMLYNLNKNQSNK